MANPNGTDLCSGTTNGNTLPTWGSGPQEREISFGAGAALTQGSEYAIVVKAPTAVLLDNGVLIYSSLSGTYTNGVSKYTVDAGENWADYASVDWWFKTKASSIVKDQSLDAVDNADDVGGEEWAAQTFIASENYTITSVILKMERFDFGGLTGTVTVSIQSTALPGPQKVTTPSPTDTYDMMTLDWQAFSWVADGAAPEEEVYNIYFGTEPGNLSLIALESPLTSVAQSYLQTVVGAAAYSDTYYWRVDTYWPSTAQTATGDVWSFSTIVFAAPSGGGRGGVGGGSGGVSGDKQLNTKTRLIAFAANKVWYEDI